MTERTEGPAFPIRRRKAVDLVSPLITVLLRLICHVGLLEFAPLTMANERILELTIVFLLFWWKTDKTKYRSAVNLTVVV
jgi:hypothetical protein